MSWHLTPFGTVVELFAPLTKDFTVRIRFVALGVAAIALMGSLTACGGETIKPVSKSSHYNSGEASGYRAFQDGPRSGGVYEVCNYTKLHSGDTREQADEWNQGCLAGAARAIWDSPVDY